MAGHSWRNVNTAISEKIKGYLLDNGGTVEDIRNVAEQWRIRFSDATFTYYTSGTLYSTHSPTNDPAVEDAWNFIESLVPSYVTPQKEFLIGLDETGKGEVFGHIVLCGIFFPSTIYGKISSIVGAADTKKRHTFDYWDKLFRELDSLRGQGFSFQIEKIPPWQVDQYNINKLMDLTYQKILNRFFREVDIGKCKIVLDDYQIGPILGRFLQFLEKQGSEVIVKSHADYKYLEAKAASLVSKRFREAIMKAIHEDPSFIIDGITIGTGNAGDPQTHEWLKRWYESGKEWPWFVKRSYSTVISIEGSTKRYKKKPPPINDKLLSRDFLENFNQGKLSVQSLSLICTSCGSIIKEAIFAPFAKNQNTGYQLKCPSCEQFILNTNLTLRYYCGYLIPDSSAIQRRVISRDLAASAFFEDFNIILVPIVRSECDKSRAGKDEFYALKKFSQKGKIHLLSPGSTSEIPAGYSSTLRDEMIINECIKHNAILITADKNMSVTAVGKSIFTIFV